ncbi:MAG: hypothetical protein PVG78_00585 [Desulfobacterales bacterium]
MGVLKKTGVLSAVAAAMLTAIGAPAAGDELAGRVDAMIAEFSPALDSLPDDKPFLIAVGSFFDPTTRCREPLCRDAEREVFERVLRRFANNGQAVVVDWKRSAPLTPAEDSAPGAPYYPLADSIKNLSVSHGGGFLITGYTDANDGGPRLRAELVAIPEGKVVARFGPPLSIPAEKGAVTAAPLSSMEAGKAPTSDTAIPRAAPAAAPDAEAGKPAAAPAQAAEPAPMPVSPRTDAAAPEPPPEQAALSSTVIEEKNFRYEGQVNSDGEKHGQGTLTFASGDTYSGQWRSGRMNGEGTYSFSDGDQYVGQWRDNKMNGRGTYIYANGDRYVGGFVNDVKDGPGIYYFKNGDRWEGSYLNGQKHGKAVYVWSNGQTKEELWNQGQKVQ